MNDDREERYLQRRVAYLRRKRDETPHRHPNWLYRQAAINELTRLQAMRRHPELMELDQHTNERTT